MKRIALAFIATLAFLLPVSSTAGQVTPHSSHSNIDWD